MLLKSFPVPFTSYAKNLYLYNLCCVVCGALPQDGLASQIRQEAYPLIWLDIIQPYEIRAELEARATILRKTRHFQSAIRIGEMIDSCLSM